LCIVRAASLSPAKDLYGLRSLLFSPP
jgi:hypothetical protein